MTITVDLTGHTLGNGKYELRDRIGRGGMAEVYRAHQSSLERDVAVKILHSFLSEDPEFKDRFEREAKNIAKLRHHHILQVYDFEFEAGPDLYYMVMEFIDGPTLRNELLQKEAKGDRLPVPEVVSISRNLASALAYAYDHHQMIHRDIKPGNVMIDRKDRRIILTDFGIAKIVSGQHITASGTMIGTPAYMAPEQGLGQPGDHRSDIYSLGVVMYQMAAGSPPYEADTPIALVLKHVNDPLPPLASFNPDLPQGLERIIYKCLAKDPEERFQDAEELVESLDNIEAAASIEVPESTTEQTAVLVEPSPRKTVVTEPPTMSDKTPRRQLLSPYVAGAIGAAVVAIVIGGILLLGGNPGQPTPTTEAVIEQTTTQPPVDEPSATEISGDATIAAIDDTSATPDLELTALAATIDIFRAERATEAAVATRPVLGTDLAPLVESGCEYNYELVSETPGNNAAILERSTITKEFVVRNSGDCAWTDGAVLDFLDGMTMGAPEAVVSEGTVALGERAVFELELTVPAHSPTDRVAQSTWQLHTLDGEPIGRLFTFNIEVIPPTATPTPTNTPTNTSTPTVTLTPTATATLFGGS